MKRRDFVKLVGSSLAAGAAGVPVMSAAQDKVVWKASDVHPLGYPTVEAIAADGQEARDVDQRPHLDPDVPARCSSAARRR